MKCLRIFATPEGESQFDEVELPGDSPQLAGAAPPDIKQTYVMRLKAVRGS